MKCRCTLQGFKDPDVPDLVRDRKTEGSTLSANDRALILQLVASCRFVLTIGDVQAACLLADREERPMGPHHVTMLKSCVKEGMHLINSSKAEEDTAWEISLSLSDSAPEFTGSWLEQQPDFSILQSQETCATGVKPAKKRDGTQKPDECATPIEIHDHLSRSKATGWLGRHGHI